MEKETRKEFLERLIPRAAGAVVMAEVARNLAWPAHLAEAAQEVGLSWNDGKFQTHPRSKVVRNYDSRDRAPGTGRGRWQKEENVLHYIDIGSLGPDVDVIVALDFDRNIQTGAKVIYTPQDQLIKETRVVLIKRAPSETELENGLETVQFNGILGGDEFHIYRISEHGGDEALDMIAQRHAHFTARTHQKVVYLGDLWLFQNEWGSNERDLLGEIIRAQRPGRPDLGIPESNFAFPREF